MATFDILSYNTWEIYSSRINAWKRNISLEDNS